MRKIDGEDVLRPRVCKDPVTSTQPDYGPLTSLYKVLPLSRKKGRKRVQYKEEIGRSRTNRRGSFRWPKSSYFELSRGLHEEGMGSVD